MAMVKCLFWPFFSIFCRTAAPLQQHVQAQAAHREPCLNFSVGEPPSEEDLTCSSARSQMHNVILPNNCHNDNVLDTCVHGCQMWSFVVMMMTMMMRTMMMRTMMMMMMMAAAAAFHQLSSSGPLYRSSSCYMLIKTWSIGVEFSELGAGCISSYQIQSKMVGQCPFCINKIIALVTKLYMLITLHLAVVVTNLAFFFWILNQLPVPSSVSNFAWSQLNSVNLLPSKANDQDEQHFSLIKVLD